MVQRERRARDSRQETGPLAGYSELPELPFQGSPRSEESGGEAELAVPRAATVATRGGSVEQVLIRRPGS